MNQKREKEGSRIVRECKLSCNLGCVPCSVIQVGSMLSSLRLNKIMAEVGAECFNIKTVKKCDVKKLPKYSQFLQIGEAI